MNDQSKPLYGILFILAAGFLLASHDGISKHLTLVYPVIMVAWARYVSQTVLMLVLFTPSMRRRITQTKRPGLQLARGLSLVGITLLFFTGLKYIPLAEATAVMFMAPLLVTIASALMGEKVSKGQWLMVVLGLVGVLVVVRPGGALFTPAILLPFGGACCFTLYQLITRRLSDTDHPVTSNFLSSLVGTVLMTVLVVSNWETPALSHGLMMAALGALAMTGHMLLTHAFKYATAATLAPFTYGQIIFAGIVGFIAFRHVPDSGALVGMAIIIASGAGSAVMQRRISKRLVEAHA